MNAIRVMSFNVRQCRGRDGRIDPERIGRVIDQLDPDVVALQEVESSAASEHLAHLGKELGLLTFGRREAGANAFLSRYPLKGVREFSLGQGGVCLKADIDLLGKRVHLFNVRLALSPLRHYRQLEALVGPELLENPDLPCPKLILGDFGDFWPWLWVCRFTLPFGRPRRPLWCPTFPAPLPLFRRDRAYFLGDIAVRQIPVAWNPLTRSASSHLPLVMTVSLQDTLEYLRTERIRERMETAPGCFRNKSVLCRRPARFVDKAVEYVDNFSECRAFGKKPA